MTMQSGLSCAALASGGSRCRRTGASSGIIPAIAGPLDAGSAQLKRDVILDLCPSDSYLVNPHTVQRAATSQNVHCCYIFRLQAAAA
jgi:hypothetical protein